jgi:hypothetical protein
MQIETTMRYHQRCVGMTMSKRQKITRPSEDVEKKELLLIVGRKVN